MAKIEAQYQAEYDAETLANAEQIKADKVRLKAAQAAAKKLDDEAQKRADAMKKVAGKRDVVSASAEKIKQKPKGPLTSVDQILRSTVR